MILKYANSKVEAECNILRQSVGNVHYGRAFKEEYKAMRRLEERGLLTITSGTYHPTYHLTESGRAIHNVVVQLDKGEK